MTDLVSTPMFMDQFNGVILFSFRWHIHNITKLPPVLVICYFILFKRVTSIFIISKLSQSTEVTYVINEFLKSNTKANHLKLAFEDINPKFMYY